MSLWGRFMAAYKAFREYGVLADPLDDQEFSAFESRRLRYAIYWSFYENSQYRNIHSWAQRYKAEYGLYKYIRGVYNPAYQLGEFWKSHLMGGALDREAEAEGALPIDTENSTLRPAIAQLWKWSNWQVNKDIFTLYGSLFGDVALQVIDDVAKGKVYLQVVHPGTIKEIYCDGQGNVKSYVIEEQRPDPRRLDRPRNPRALTPELVVTYTEVAERDGDSVVWKTYLNGAPYPWYGIEEWDEPYGFIPMVICQHNNVGLEWGWSELHPSREKFHEVDDLGSKLHDQIRKMVDAPWLFAGVKEPTTTPRTANTTATTDRPQPGREEIPALYGPVGATAHPLVAPLDIVATTAEIEKQLAAIERDYPELKIDLLRASGEVSGRALRIAQQPTEDKVKQRRAGYDSALERAQQMAIAIGGYRGLFPGFGLDSYEAGALDHSISERPVFAEDPLDGVEIDKMFWEAAGLAAKAGVPLSIYLKRAGWSEEDIAELEASPERVARLEAMQMAVAMGNQELEQNRDDNGDKRAPGGDPGSSKDE